MFFRRSKADDANAFVVSSFGENHYVKPRVYQADGDKAGFSIIEPIIFALYRGVPIKACRRLQGNAVLGSIGIILGWIIFDPHLFIVHPLKRICKSESGV